MWLLIVLATLYLVGLAHVLSKRVENKKPMTFTDAVTLWLAMSIIVINFIRS